MGLMDTIKEKNDELQKKIKQLNEQLALETKVDYSGDQYIVLSVILKEKLIGVGSKNLKELETVINAQCKIGYKLHTCSVSTLYSKGFAGGDRLQATLVFEKI